MHRRQYIPGSDQKLSRRDLRVKNARLHDEIARRDAAEVIARHAAEEARKKPKGIRGFFDRAKRWLNTPIRFSKTA